MGCGTSSFLTAFGIAVPHHIVVSCAVPTAGDIFFTTLTAIDLVCKQGVGAGGSAWLFQAALHLAADVKGERRKCSAVNVLEIFDCIPLEKERLYTQSPQQLELIPVGCPGGDEEKIPRTCPELQIFPQMERHSAVKNIEQFMDS
jgi:hypothetical protein